MLDRDGRAAPSGADAAQGAVFGAHGHQHSSKSPLDAGRPHGRVDLIIGADRRRRWSDDDKARITLESLETGANVSAVARRNGVSVGLLHYWRRKAREFGSGEPLSFVPVRSGLPLNGPRSKTELPGTIELFLSGVTIRVVGQIDADALRAVLSAVRTGP